MIDVQFTVFADGLPKGLKFLPARREKPRELHFLSTQRSAVYDYLGSNPIEFFTEVPAPPDPGHPGAPQVGRVTVARVAIPYGMKQCLLLFSVESGWEHQPVPHYVVQVFDDSRTAMPLDCAAFINATGRPLFGTFGDREIQLPVGMSQPIRMGAGAWPVLLKVNVDAKLLPVYGDVIALGPNQRVTVVLFPPVGAENIHIRRRLLYDPDRLPTIKRPPEGKGS